MSDVIVSECESELESEFESFWFSDECGPYVAPDIARSDAGWSDVFAECVSYVVA